MRKVCVSTACWWGLDRNLNRVISTIAKQKIDGVELCFVYLKELLSCKLSRKSIDYLKGLEFNTIHAPMKHHYTNSTRTKNIISKIAKLYDAIDAKFVIIHPWLVKSYKHIDASGMNVCMENGPNKANRGLHYARDLKLLDAHA
ncbi:MAG: hypothetical protein J4415_01410, partial [Candidatus Diapherotrites archaeon]|nr:hypothetical protein [Candidatus Diapherotrites archaeon]